MSKFLVGLALWGMASAALAQGNYIYPANLLPTAPLPTLPSASYYPVTPYYPAYPYATVQPYYPLQMPMYSYQGYPNPLQPPMSASLANPTPAPNYAYTSPYNSNQPATPGPRPAPAPQANKETKPWGDTRYIWPDFYTDQSSDLWDKMINAPHDLGYMPGGWRFPSFSSPDPVTVGDAVANQVPPIMEEVPNFMNFTN